MDPLSPSSSFPAILNVTNLNHVNATASTDQLLLRRRLHSADAAKFVPGVIRYRTL